jgi:aspartate/methionine/tyrosine aminotransferase
MSQDAFRDVPMTGVIYANGLAAKLGFYRGHPDFVNMAQGQAETGMLEGGLERMENIPIAEIDQEYAPVAGLKELRIAIADMYNELYRQDKEHKFTFENISVAAGGRAALTRLFASVGNCNVGHFLPDYTAYSELLTTFTTFNTIPIMLSTENGYKFSPQDLRDEIQGRGLSALLVSNPCNPTGAVIAGEELKGWVQAGRDLDCSIIFDEFYSSYVYDKVGHGETLSSARYIEDIEKDNALIVNGIGKNQRYPGLRVAWVVGSKKVIKSINSAGSFLDGGAPRPIQKAVIPLLSPENVTKETKALQNAFGKKRKLLVEGLKEMGVIFDREPEGAFYVWINVSNLPDGINTGESFQNEAMKRKIITIQGSAFDINPGKRMRKAGYRFKNYLRLSYGPDILSIEKGLERLREMVKDFS